MAQYPIPQFIEEEGKIIFFLTYRQFFLLVGGGFACVLLYLVLAKISVYLFLISALIVMAIVGVIAFLKVNNESVFSIFMNFLGFSMRSKVYTWKKKDFANPVSTGRIKKADSGKEFQASNSPMSKLNDIKKLVETKTK